MGVSCLCLAPQTIVSFACGDHAYSPPGKRTMQRHLHIVLISDVGRASLKVSQMLDHSLRDLRPARLSSRRNVLHAAPPVTPPFRVEDDDDFLLKGQVVLSDFAAFIFSLLNRALVV